MQIETWQTDLGEGIAEAEAGAVAEFRGDGLTFDEMVAPVLPLTQWAREPAKELGRREEAGAGRSRPERLRPGLRRARGRPPTAERP